jgi:ABC-type lipoprotein release transport system permease subunit
LTLRFAWRNLWRNRRRTLLTIVAVGFGVALVTGSMSLREGAYAAAIDLAVHVMTGHVQVQSRAYVEEPILRHDIPNARAIAQQLREQLPHVAVAVRGSGFALLASEHETLAASVIGVEVEREPRVSTIPGDVRAGRFLADDHAQEIVLGETLARNLGAKTGDVLTLLGTGREGSVAAASLTVVGVFRTGVPEIDRQVAQMPLGTFQDTFAMGEGAHAIVLRADDGTNVTVLHNQVQAGIAAQTGLVALGWDDLLPGMRQLIDFDFAASFVFYIALIVVITVGILNTFIMSVLERTREFGMVLALGIAPGQLIRVVLTETVMLIMLGITLGVVVGAAFDAYFIVHGLVIPGMAEIARGFGLPDRLYPVMSVSTLLTGPALVLSFSLVVASLPALRLRKLVPVEAMHSV